MYVLAAKEETNEEVIFILNNVFEVRDSEVA